MMTTEPNPTSVRPVVFNYRAGYAADSHGLTPAESIEVTRVAYATYSRIMDRDPLAFRAAEKAGFVAARRRLKVLLAARARPEADPVVSAFAPSLDVPMMVPVLCGGAPIERQTPVRPDPRRRVVRGWRDEDQAAHGCL